MEYSHESIVFENWFFLCRVHQLDRYKTGDVRGHSVSFSNLDLKMVVNPLNNLLLNPQHGVEFTCGMSFPQK